MKVVREPYGIVHVDKSPMKDVYGGDAGMVFVECMRIRPVEVESKTVIVFSHPIGGGSFLPLVNSLAANGVHVIYCNPRYRGNDTALILEKCVLDLGACIKDLKKRFGYEQVLLGGWSGGGSLSMFYQDQAENPTIRETPAGDPADLVAAELVPADGVSAQRQVWVWSVIALPIGSVWMSGEHIVVSLKVVAEKHKKIVALVIRAG